LKPNGTKITYEPADGVVYSLDELTNAVGGDFELVRVMTDSNMNPASVAYMVVNEDGHRLKLPYNDMATRLYKRARKTHSSVVGTVLICDLDQIV